VSAIVVVVMLVLAAVAANVSTSTTNSCHDTPSGTASDRTRARGAA
jgi:hypothetical protein